MKSDTKILLFLHDVCKSGLDACMVNDDLLSLRSYVSQGSKLSYSCINSVSHFGVQSRRMSALVTIRNY